MCAQLLCRQPAFSIHLFAMFAVTIRAAKRLFAVLFWANYLNFYIAASSTRVSTFIANVKRVRHVYGIGPDYIAHRNMISLPTYAAIILTTYIAIPSSAVRIINELFTSVTTIQWELAGSTLPLAQFLIGGGKICDLLQKLFVCWQGCGVYVSCRVHVST